ncbi:hypothetical protein ACW5UC_23810 [Priestia aryabhattai]|uniref:hypothetical protein n=1 Tax=Priestia megaterium TaxID=1404 RepID=UPI003F9E3C5B
MINKELETYLERRINEATVILSFRILLENVINNGAKSTLTKTQIEEEFNRQNYKYGISTFRSDYVLRQSGNDKNAISQHKDQFFIKPNFIQGMNTPDFREVANLIDQHWDKLSQEQHRFMNNIEAQLEKTLGIKKDFIEKMLLKVETRKKGQCFEVTSFSILKVYLQNRGFELNRYSTVYSNDGGIDFTAQNAVYQVTTKLDKRKFKEDLNKVPLKHRIFVFRELSANFDKKVFDNELILDYLSPTELIDYLNYLSEREPAERNLNKIIENILSEFKREYYVSK